MKKGIYAFLAVLAVFALVMAGCETDSGTTSGTKVTLDQTNLTVENGKTGKITATTDPADVELEWTSDNEDVAFVNPVGVVTGMSVGTAVITAKAEDGGKATCTVTVTASVTSEDEVKVVGDTLEHYTAKLVGVNHFGDNLGTANADGSYTFDGTAEQYKGGGAQYNFPSAKVDDSWKLSDYDLVEVSLKVTEGSVQVIVKKSGGNTDLSPYPSGSQYLTLDANVNGGNYSYKAVITDAGSGIGFQRNQSGPATVAIEKVVFTKVTEYTITFAGGGATISIPPIKVLTDRKVTLPYKPKWSGHTFIGWYDGEILFDAENTLINKDYTLTAKWTDGEPPPVDMKLNLDPASWGTLPSNAANQSGGWTWPSDYATTAYVKGVLTLTFSGMNRQRAIIPLNADQIYELQDPALIGITYKIVGTVKNEDGTESSAEFRCHLGNPSGTSNWNGTDTKLQTALKDHLEEYLPFSSNKSVTTLAWFMIQAMYVKNGSDTVQSGFPKVIITVDSITIEPNTQ